METLQGRDIYPPTRSGKKHGNIGHRLRTRRHEPLMWTVSYGKGRIFVDLLGHCGNDPNMTYSMRCTGFQVTLLRGCEWAATGAVTQEVPTDFPLKDTYTLRPEFKAPFHAYPETKH